jgi:acetylornithine deacetylase/succinyl-diaminopimelate desuccinylase-like protein
MGASIAQTDQVLARIDREELVRLALDLGNIDSPTGQEGPVADYLMTTLRAWGFAPRTVALLTDRPNVLARLPGRGGGRSLLFNSHMDTIIASDEIWVTPRAGDRIFHSAWRDGEELIGVGVYNDKGSMAAWLIAARAIKESGVTLPGDLVLTMVPGEIGVEPVDEFMGPAYVAKEAGARFLAEHGAVADYAIVAEGTHFDVAWTTAGKAFFKITVHGDLNPIYTPFLTRPVPVERHPNAIVRIAPVIDALERWALRYEEAHRYESAGGTIIPKVNIGAIRGGVPYKITKSVGVCALYLDVRITPIQDPLDVADEIREVLSGTGIAAEVEMFAYRRAYEGQGVKPLVEAVSRVQLQLLGRVPGIARSVFTGMWRDTNVFNAMGIPTIMWGAAGQPDRLAMRIDDLLTAARLYALVALDVCSQPRAR